jgi:A/G-specific adenine glycosylase
LWKFPGGEKGAGESLEEALERTVAEEVGIEVDPGKSIASVKHAYTHFRVTMHVFPCHGKRGRPKALRCDQWKWIRPRELHAYPFSKVDRKVMEAVDM